MRKGSKWDSTVVEEERGWSVKGRTNSEGEGKENNLEHFSAEKVYAKLHARN